MKPAARECLRHLRGQRPLQKFLSSSVMLRGLNMAALLQKDESSYLFKTRQSTTVDGGVHAAQADDDLQAIYNGLRKQISAAEADRIARQFDTIVSRQPRTAGSVTRLQHSANAPRAVRRYESSFGLARTSAGSGAIKTAAELGSLLLTEFSNSNHLSSADTVWTSTRRSGLLPSPESFASFLSLLSRAGRHAEVRLELERVLGLGLQPSNALLREGLLACKAQKDYTGASQLWSLMVGSNLRNGSTAAGRSTTRLNATVDDYNCLLAVAAEASSNGRDGTDLIATMRLIGIKPDETSYIHAMTSAGRCGYPRRAFSLVDAMMHGDGIVPTSATYACLAAVAARAAQDLVAWQRTKSTKPSSRADPDGGCPVKGLRRPADAVELAGEAWLLATTADSAGNTNVSWELHAAVVDCAAAVGDLQLAHEWLQRYRGYVQSLNESDVRNLVDAATTMSARSGLYDPASAYLAVAQTAMQDAIEDTRAFGVVEQMVVQAHEDGFIATSSGSGDTALASAPQSALELLVLAVTANSIAGDASRASAYFSLLSLNTSDAAVIAKALVPLSRCAGLHANRAASSLHEALAAVAAYRQRSGHHGVPQHMHEAVIAAVCDAGRPALALRMLSNLHVDRVAASASMFESILAACLLSRDVETASAALDSVAMAGLHHTPRMQALVVLASRLVEALAAPESERSDDGSVRDAEANVGSGASSTIGVPQDSGVADGDKDDDEEGGSRRTRRSRRSKPSSSSAAASRARRGPAGRQAAHDSDTGNDDGTAEAGGTAAGTGVESDRNDNDADTALAFDALRDVMQSPESRSGRLKRLDGSTNTAFGGRDRVVTDAELAGLKIHDGISDRDGDGDEDDDANWEDGADGDEAVDPVDQLLEDAWAARANAVPTATTLEDGSTRVTFEAASSSGDNKRGRRSTNASSVDDSMLASPPPALVNPVKPAASIKLLRAAADLDIPLPTHYARLLERVAAVELASAGINIAADEEEGHSGSFKTGDGIGMGDDDDLYGDDEAGEMVEYDMSQDDGDDGSDDFNGGEMVFDGDQPIPFSLRPGERPDTLLNSRSGAGPVTTKEKSAKALARGVANRRPFFFDAPETAVDPGSTAATTLSEEASSGSSTINAAAAAPPAATSHQPTLTRGPARRLRPGQLPS